MSLDDVISAMQALGMKKDDMWEPLEWTDFGWKEVDKAMDNITDKGGILNSLFASLSNGAKSFGAALSGVWKLLMANKWILAIAGIAFAIKGISEAIITPKEATEAMTESFGEFENAKNEVENLNTELEQTKDKIADLQAKGHLSLIEKEELAKLKETQKSLEMQKDIAEELAVAKAEQAATDAALAYEKNFRKEISQAATDEYLRSSESSGYTQLFSDDTNVSSLIAGIKQYKKLQSEVTDDAEEWTSYQESIDDATTSIWEQADALMEQKTNLEESKALLEENGRHLSVYQQQTLDNITDSLNYIYKEMSPDTWKQMQIDDVFSKDQFSNTKQELTDLAKEYDNLADFTNAAMAAYGEFNTALLHNGVKMSDVTQSIFSEAGIIDTEAVRQQLVDTFSSIAENTNLDKNLFANWAKSLSDEDLEVAYKIMADTSTAHYDLETWKNAIEEFKESEALDINLDISVEKEGLDKVNSAISESVSETGLLTETIDSLKSRYRAIEDFDAATLFENTANGIRLNTKELSRLEEQYSETKVNELTDALEVANKRLKEANILSAANSNSKYAKAYELRAKSALEEVNTIKQLIAQYKALNGAYAKAMKAAETPNASAMKENVKGLWDSVKELRKAGKVGSDDFQSFMDLIYGNDYSDKNSIGQMVKDFDSLNNNIQILDENGKVISTLRQSIGSFFADGWIGAKNFVDALQSANNILGEDWFTDNGDGTISINANTAEMAEALHISEELATILLTQLEDYGWNVDFDPAVDSAEELSEKIKESAKELEEFKSEAERTGIVPIIFETESKSYGQLRDNISKIKEEIGKIKETYGADPSKSGYSEYGNALLGNYALQLKDQYRAIQEMTSQRIDVSGVADEYKGVATEFNAFKDAFAEHQANVDTYGKDSIQATESWDKMVASATELGKLGEELNIESLQFDTDSIDDFMTFLKTTTGEGIDLPLKPSGEEQIDAILAKVEDKEMTITVNVTGLDEASQLADTIDRIESKNVELNANSSESNPSGTVTYDGDFPTEAPNINGEAIYEATGFPTEAPTVYGEAVYTVRYSGGGAGKVVGLTKADGTAYANGIAFARGSWGIKDSGVALGGEEGQELVVRNGRYFTIGDRSAEFFQYKKNDIIFNAEQTKQILQQGKITRGQKRGRALAKGTTSGLAFDGGVSATGTNAWYGTYGSGGGAGGGSDENEKVFDWIETLIDRIDRAIDKFERKVNNAFTSWENRSDALLKQREEIEHKISVYQRGYDRYIQEANSVGLMQFYRDKVERGEIEISTITDEDLADQISKYQEFYEKALDCRDAIDELTISLAECYQVAFDNAIAQYDGLLAVVEHEKSMLDEKISQSEAMGFVTSKRFYEAQADSEIEKIKLLYKERAELEEKLNTAVKDIENFEGSETYMDMVEEINNVTLAIEESNTELLNLDKSIREIDWEIFDLLQDRVSNISEETDFLIDLLSNKKLYDDNGQLTNEGLTTVGLHGQNYNIYSAQADMYADEIEKLNKQIEDDPYNQDLINRRNDLLEAQRNNILAAENEKQAIVDLVEEGYNAELDALQESIDAYNDRLDSAKDLYEYQKKVKDQVKEISSIEKQIAAYEGDESQEAKAKVQKLKVSLEDAKSNLEETQYDKYISDQKELLDELYIEYEDLLNERLDNVNARFEEMIAKSNENASTINDTLSNTAESVGYKLSNELQNIWSSDDGLSSILKSNNLEIMSTNNKIRDTVITISNDIQSMMKKLNGIAGFSVVQVSASTLSAPDNHATGIRRISQDDVAWTQEGRKTEFIVRPSDGAILTPVAQDDSILSSYASGNIWKMANSPTEFIRDNLGVNTTNVPNSQCVQQTYTQNLENVVFNLPNVKNYDEMLSAMQKDKNFERLILSMSIDRLAGRSYLAKNKSIR